MKGEGCLTKHEGSPQEAGYAMMYSGCCFKSGPFDLYSCISIHILYEYITVHKTSSATCTEYFSSAQVFVCQCIPMPIPLVLVKPGLNLLGDIWHRCVFRF